MKEGVKQKAPGYEYYLKQVRLRKEGGGKTFEQHMQGLTQRGENPGYEYYLHRWSEIRGDDTS